MVDKGIECKSTLKRVKMVMRCLQGIFLNAFYDDLVNHYSSLYQTLNFTDLDLFNALRIES